MLVARAIYAISFTPHFEERRRASLSFAVDVDRLLFSATLWYARGEDETRKKMNEGKF